MKWELADLREKAIKISEIIKTTKDQKLLEYLNQELKLINSMIEYMISDAPDAKKFAAEWIVSDADYQKKVEYLGKYLSPITIGLEFLRYAEHLKVYIFIKKMVNEKEFINIIEKFFADFEFNLSNLYNELVINKALYLIPDHYYDSLTAGITNYLPTFGCSYVGSIYDGKVENMPCLPHEMGHVYQMSGADYERYESMVYSVFREAFAHFVELAFIDYLKHTKYFKNAMNLERRFLEGMSIIRELYGTAYVATQKISSIDNKLFINNNGDEIPIADTSRYISKVLACYFLDLYRHDSEAIEKIEKFNKMFRIGEEYKYVEEIPTEKLVEAVSSQFKNHYQDIQKRKNFKIDRNVK